MTHALQRFSAAIFGWIPDLSGIPPRRQATLGVIASVLLHLLIILLVALLIRTEQRQQQQQQKIGFAKPKIRPRTIELTIIPPEPEIEPSPPFTLAPPTQPFIDSRGLEIAQEAALNPIFQADENMRAASELPASGDLPLPSQAGRDRPFNAFKAQRSLLGMAAPSPFPPAPDVPAAAPVPPAPPVAAAPPAPPATAEPPPSPVPEPVAKTETAPAAAKDPLREVMTPKDDEIALSTKAPPTAITQLERSSVPPPPPPQPAATPRPPDQQQAMLVPPVPVPQAPRDAGYQPEQEPNRIEGNISNRGKKAVDAVATPLAKYRKQVNDAIGSRWYLYVRDSRRMTLISTGSARVSFFISLQGEVQGIKLESNSANESFADLCLDAVRDAREQIKELKLPTEAMAPLKDGRLECSLTFTFYNL